MIVDTCEITDFPHVKENGIFKFLRIYGEKGYSTLPFYKNGKIGGTSKFRGMKPIGLAWYWKKPNGEVRVRVCDKNVGALTLAYNENALRHLEDRETFYWMIQPGEKFKWEKMLLTKQATGSKTEKGSWIELEPTERVEKCSTIS